ncbi:MAG: hypothetical protein R3328_00280 [Planococcaceae bacterium]|nr:hypothetical protein [Planococcaceae bacterium]
MNVYVKRMVDSRLEYLESEEQEIEKDINHLKEVLIKEEAKLKLVREEKAALTGNK